LEKFRGVFAKFRGSSDFPDFRIYFPKDNSVEYVHGTVDFIKCRPLDFGSMAQIKSSESVSRLLISVFITDPTDEAVGSGRGRHGLVLVAVHHGRARWLTGVRVFSSYGGRLSMRFAPTGSQRRGERDYANLNRWRAATEPSNSEAARPVLGDGEGSLR
jgi:hypothetical protein